MKKKQSEGQNKQRGALTGHQQTILDTIRVFAALCVMIGHSFYLFQVTGLKDQTYYLHIQNMGVVIFFLLSGFLSAYSISQKNQDRTYTFREFFVHKVLRIYREYIPGILFIAVLDKIAININDGRYGYYDGYKIRHFFGDLFMLHGMGPRSFLLNYFMPLGTGRTLWTLAVEWWIYMLFGALYLFICNKQKITLPKALLFGGILFMASDYIITGRGGGLGFVFALGVLAYYCYPLLKKMTAWVLFFVSFIGYFAYGFWMKEAYTVYSFLILWVLLCAVLKIGSGKKNKGTKRNPVLAFVSKSTFMLYLTHYSILNVFLHSDHPWSVAVKILVGIILSLLTAFVMYFVFGELDVAGKLVALVRKRDK